MGASRLNLENGDFFAYVSPHTSLLKWAKVVEEPGEPDFLRCQTFSAELPEGTEDLVNVSRVTTMFRVNPWTFDFAREQGWPETLEQFYALSRARKEAVSAASR